MRVRLLPQRLDSSNMQKINSKYAETSPWCNNEILQLKCDYNNMH